MLKTRLPFLPTTSSATIPYDGLPQALLIVALVASVSSPALAASAAKKASQPVEETNAAAQHETPSAHTAGDAPLSLDRLFEKAFKGRLRRPNQALKLQSSLTIDDIPAGTVFVLSQSGASSQAQLDLASFARAAEPFIVAPVLEALKTLANTLGYVRLQDLSDVGLVSEFNPQTLKTTVRVPAELRVLQNDSLRSRRPRVYGQRLSPSRVSAVLNIAAARTYQHADLGSGWRPFTADFRGALNIKNFVLEGDFVYRQGSPRPWQRNDLRLVKDVPSRALRTSFGDLRYSTSGYQSALMMGGLSVERNFSTRPYESVQSNGTAMFVLTSPSRVEFYVNGQLVDTRQLPTGPHRVSDFPLGAGANDIEVRITDAYGRVETKSFPFFFASDVLSEGTHDFSYNIGYLTSVDNEGIRHYATDTPTLSLSHRIGVSPALTVGLNYQGNRDQNLVGGEVNFATMLGSFGINAAVSRTGNLEKSDGKALTVQYSFTPQNSRFGQSFSLQWRTQSPKFQSLSLTPNDSFTNPVSSSFAARYSQRIVGNVSATLSGTYDLWRTHQRGNSQTLSFSKSLTWGPYVSLSLSRTVSPIFTGPTPALQQDKRLLMGLNWTLGQSNHMLSADYDSLSHLTRTRWNYYSGTGVGAISASASALHTPQNNGAEGQISYTGNRFTASASHTLAAPNEGSFSSTTSLRAETALVFADGHATLARPINDSFVMVAPAKALKDVPVKVNADRQGRFVARADALGPAVVPNTTSYYVQNITIDRSDLPVGTHIDYESFYTEAPYKSGAVVTIGTDAVVILRAQLMDHAGAPIELATVELISQDNPQAASIIGFTNRKGRFTIEGLSPGRYTLRAISQDHAYTEHVVIPEETRGIYNLKSITLSKE